jgi:hypothetical protein
VSTSQRPERTRATGKITVKSYVPAPCDEPEGGPTLSRIHVEETFSGDTEAGCMVDFLQAQMPDGSASFVGIERVSGSLGGRSGTFLLQDQGTLSDSTVSGQCLSFPGRERARCRGCGAGQLFGAARRGRGRDTRTLVCLISKAGGRWSLTDWWSGKREPDRWRPQPAEDSDNACRRGALRRASVLAARHAA